MFNGIQYYFNVFSFIRYVNFISFFSYFVEVTFLLNCPSETHKRGLTVMECATEHILQSY